jgi:hypothetical protein
MSKFQKSGLVTALICLVLVIVAGEMLQGTPTPRVWKGEEAVVVGGPGYARGAYLVSVVPIEPGKKPAPLPWYIKAACFEEWSLKKGDTVRLYTKKSGTIWAEPTKVETKLNKADITSWYAWSRMGLSSQYVATHDVEHIVR